MWGSRENIVRFLIPSITVNTKRPQLRAFSYQVYGDLKLIISICQVFKNDGLGRLRYFYNMKRMGNILGCAFAQIFEGYSNVILIFYNRSNIYSSAAAAYYVRRYNLVLAKINSSLCKNVSNVFARFFHLA